MNVFRINDIGRLKDGIREEFSGVKSEHKFGVFSRFPGILDELEEAVLNVVDDCSCICPVIPEVAPKPSCVHKWRDCDYWYMEYAADVSTFRYKIFEPYVCIYCKERNDKQLQNGEEPITSERSANDIIQEFFEKFPALCHRAIVEDAVNDMIMVDREHLQMVDVLHGNAPIDDKITLRLTQGGKYERKRTGEDS